MKNLDEEFKVNNLGVVITCRITKDVFKCAWGKEYKVIEVTKIETNPEKIPTCGCGKPNLDKNKKVKSPDVETIIAYNKKDDNPNNPYGDTYFIFTYANGMSFTQYICNEEVLPQKVKELKNTGGKLNVKYYEGFSKDLCKGIIAPPLNMYSQITLTKIELL